MALVSSANKLCKEICNALGLKNVKELTLHMKVGEIVTVKVEYYPEENGIVQFPTMFKEYDLVEKVNIKEKTALGDEWRSYQVDVERQDPTFDISTSSY